MPARINLVAVQAQPTLADYRDADAFRAKIVSLMQKVTREADLSLPTLVSFPELIGMYLAFVPFYWDDLEHEKNLQNSATKIVTREFAGVPEAHSASPKAAARYILFVQHALEAERIYVDTFSALAREHGVYLAAGSIALPPTESEPSKGGPHIVDETKVYNTAYLFSPRGVCINRVPKVNMTAGFERWVMDGGPRSDLIPADTPLGRIGTLVCFDGFHETLVEHYDSLAADILLKPSYNMHTWDGPSTYDPAHKEGENWLCTGCPSIIQGRENIHYGVNAMMTGAVFQDTAAEGLSSIAVNTGVPGAPWQDGILAIASRPDTEEIVVAAVDAVNHRP